MIIWSMKCGHCREHVAAPIVFGAADLSRQADVYALASQRTYWLQCPKCYEGSVKLKNGSIHPIASATQAYAELPTDVATAWSEAGVAYAAGAYTASEIMCRKILMHIAVDRAKSSAGKSFVEYIDDLEKAGLVVAGLKSVIDLIRKRGNTANHDLPASTEAECGQTISITDHLLKGVYVLPGLVL